MNARLFVCGFLLRHALMAKSSTIEPVNIDLYEKAWGHRPQPQKKKQPHSRKKKKGRGRKKQKKK